jgi:SNF family Na+-dependent transporter
MDFFTALTTGCDLLEPAVAHLTEQKKFSKAKAAIIAGAVMISVGFSSLYSITFLDFLGCGVCRLASG